MNRLWLPIGSLITVAAIAFGTFNAVALIAHEEVTETATFAADGVTALRIDNDDGTVEVVGSGRDDIALVADISHGLRRTSHAAAVEGDTLVVDGDCPGGPLVWCSVDYRIEVPAELTVDVDNRNGSVSVRDVAGAVTVRSSNGRLELAGIAGDVTARTSNGSIDARGLQGDTVSADTSNGAVSLSFATVPSAVVADTSNGSIEIVVPEDPDVAYRVDAGDNFVGRTEIGVRTDPTSERSIVAETSNGSVTVRYSTG